MMKKFIMYGIVRGFFELPTPLRKNFPLSGFNESRYNSIKSRVVYENVELAQEYRTFEFLSPWENYKKK